MLAIVAAGCGQQQAKIQVADPLAQSDPNARGKQLLATFDEAEDKATWVRQNTFALTIFDKVTDPQVKADYNSKIAPLLGAAK